MPTANVYGLRIVMREGNNWLC